LAAPQYPYGWFPQPELATKKGVGNILNAMYATILIMVMAIPLVVTLWLRMDSLQGDFDSGMMKTIAILAIFGIIVVIGALYALINYLIGLVRMHRGRMEFGDAHSKKVSRAILLIVLMIILTIVSSVVIAALAYASVASFTDTSQTINVADTWLVAQGAGSAIGVVSAICQNLVMVYLVYELSDEKHRTYLWAGFGVNVAASVVSAVVTVSLYFLLSEQALIDLSNSYALSFLSLPFSVVGFVLYLVCYRDAHRRLTSGELKPVNPPQMPYPYPPMYPPQPYYAPPPQQAPPQEMRTCQGCGRQVPLAYNVCPHCGRPASLPPPPPPPP
jgi:hypothetical protein